MPINNVKQLISLFFDQHHKKNDLKLIMSSTYILNLNTFKRNRGIKLNKNLLK